MKTLYLIRHGQSTANAGGVTQDNALIALSDLGLTQARALAHEKLSLLPIKPSEVYTSSYLRTQQTAAPYCQAVGAVPKVHPTFHEFTNIDPALLQGLTGDERWPFVKAYWDNANPNQREGNHAETFIEFDARVAAFMRELPNFEDQTVLFGHGVFFALLVWKNLGFTVDTTAGMSAFRGFQLALPMPNCAIYTLNINDDAIQIKAVLPSMIKTSFL